MTYFGTPATTCKRCGVSVAEMKPNTLYCSKCRLEIARENSRVQNKRIAEKKKAALNTKPCELCGNEISALGNNRYCPDCRDKVAEQRKAEYRGKIVSCRCCGDKFLSIRNALYCSEECRKEFARHPKMTPTKGRSAARMSISELALTALQNGTSYGKFVAREGL